MQQFMLQSNVYFGKGAAQNLPRTLGDQGFRKLGIVVDAAVSELPPSFALLEALRTTSVEAVRVYKSDPSREPTYADLDVAAEAFRTERLDVIIGIGGGSALDLAKGVGILQANPGNGIEYRGMDKVLAPGTPVVLVPTTAGTGSEATLTASFIDEESGVKLGINGRHVGCLFAVLDPVFVATCPPAPTIAAGLDALVHACEAVTCRTANDVSVLLGCEATRRMFTGLLGAVKEPSDLGARADTLLGSHYAGLAMWNAGGGPSSAISYPLGVHYGVPHGIAGGLLLPHVVAFNVAAGYCDGYAAIYDRLADRGTRTEPVEQKANSFCSQLSDLYERIGAPRDFGAYGVTHEDIPDLTRLTVQQRQANLDLNPAAFGESDVVALLEHVVA